MIPQSYRSHGDTARFHLNLPPLDSAMEFWPPVSGTLLSLTLVVSIVNDPAVFDSAVSLTLISWLSCQ
jgi:hypothetical protein